MLLLWSRCGDVVGGRGAGALLLFCLLQLFRQLELLLLTLPLNSLLSLLQLLTPLLLHLLLL
jgi:hypothetical protein